MEDSECIFCKIVRKEEFAAILYEDDDIMAFMDIKPINEGVMFEFEFTNYDY